MANGKNLIAVELATKLELGLISLSIVVTAICVVLLYEPIDNQTGPVNPEAIGISPAPSESSSELNQLGRQISSLSNLFGVPVQNEESAQEAVFQALPETPLNLKLFGTIAHTEENLSSAWISANNNSPVRYFLNQKVEGQSELVHVAEGYVVLRRNGEDELLKLPMLRDMQFGPELEQRIYQ